MGKYHLCIVYPLWNTPVLDPHQPTIHGSVVGWFTAASDRSPRVPSRNQARCVCWDENWIRSTRQQTPLPKKNHHWLVVGPPLWKIWLRQLGWLEIPNISGKMPKMATKPPTRSGCLHWTNVLTFETSARFGGDMIPQDPYVHGRLMPTKQGYIVDGGHVDYHKKMAYINGSVMGDDSLIGLFLVSSKSQDVTDFTQLWKTWWIQIWNNKFRNVQWDFFGDSVTVETIVIVQAKNQQTKLTAKAWANSGRLLIGGSSHLVSGL